MTTFATPLNDVLTTLASAYTAGSGSLVLATGAGALFGSPTPSAPVRLTVVTAASYGSTAEVSTIFQATGRTGDTLTGVTAVEGTTDRDYASGAKVEMRVTAAAIGDLNAAVNTLEAATYGTVTSVALDAPTNLFNSPVSGSPVTTAGTLTLALTARTGNVVFASPSGGGLGAPAFRSLVAADIPNLSGQYSAVGHVHAHSEITSPAVGDDHTQYAYLAPATTARNTIVVSAAGQVGMTIRAHASQGTTALWRLRDSADAANLAEFSSVGYLGVGAAPTTIIASWQPVGHFKGSGDLAVQCESTAAAAIFYAKGATAAGIFMQDSGATSQERIFEIISDDGWLKFFSLLNDHTTNANLMGIRRDGYVNIGRGSSNVTGIIAALGVQALAASLPALIARGAGSQSGNLVEWQDSSAGVYGTISENGYWTTRKTSAPADGELSAGEVALWFDSTNGAAKLKIKGKSANGTVVAGEVALA